MKALCLNVKECYHLSWRDLIIIALLSIAGLAVCSDGGGLCNRYFWMGWPTPLIHLAFRGSCYRPGLETKWIVFILFSGVLLPVSLYLVFSKQISAFKQKHGKCIRIIIYGIPVVAVVTAFQPEFIVLMLPWLLFWIIFGYINICLYRKSLSCTYAAAPTGLLHFSYAAIFPSNLLSVYAYGTKFITILSDNDTFPKYYRWTEVLFPMVSILLYTLPLAVIVVLLRKLNWKRKLFYLIPGIALWLYITKLPCTRHKEFLNDQFCWDIHCLLYYDICEAANYRALDKSLIRRIDSRKKKATPENDIIGDCGNKE